MYSTGSVTEPVATRTGSGDGGPDPSGPRCTEPQRYERIAERIAADIRAGRLAPGERLPSERELARRLEVGRASVREAIAALRCGACSRRGRAPAPSSPPTRSSGSAPGELSAHDAGPFDLLEARLLLEPGVAALAARRGRRDAEAEALLDAMDAAEADGRPRAAGTTATAASTASSPR